MPVTLESLSIDQLTVRERLELIEQIWDSLPPGLELPEVPEWQLAELVHRRSQADVRPREGKPWREELAPLETKS